MASMLRTSCVIGTPSTMMSPRWCSSSRLMVRMKVDFPDPEGPTITTFCPPVDGSGDATQNVEVAEPLVHVPSHDHRAVV